MPHRGRPHHHRICVHSQCVVLIRQPGDGALQLADQRQGGGGLGDLGLSPKSGLLTVQRGHRRIVGADDSRGCACLDCRLCAAKRI